MSTENQVTEAAAASGRILDQIPTPIMTVGPDMNVTYMNDAGCRLLRRSWEQIEGEHCYDLFGSTHCNTPECRLRKAMEEDTAFTARAEMTQAGETMHIEYTAVPLKGKEGETIGGLEYILDVTDKVRNEQRLLEQSRTIREMSTPVTKLWEGIMVIPVVGVVDSVRAQQMMETMLAEIAETASRVIIMDIQGVAAVDTAVANHFIKITRATKMMGCECIISGISSAVAQTLVHLGINLEAVRTTATLKDALQVALAELGHVVQAAKQ